MLIESSNKNWSRITKHVSLELSIPQADIERIFLSQFRLVRDVMQKGEDECVILKHLGKFAVKPGRKRFLERMRELKKEKTDAVRAESGE